MARGAGTGVPHRRPVATRRAATGRGGSRRTGCGRVRSRPRRELHEPTRRVIRPTSRLGRSPPATSLGLRRRRDRREGRRAARWRGDRLHHRGDQRGDRSALPAPCSPSPSARSRSSTPTVHRSIRPVDFPGSCHATSKRPTSSERARLRAALAGQLAGQLDGQATSLNTTIGVVATSARLTKAEATKLAGVAHDGLARAIRPAHSMFDGDTVFALATGEHELGDEPAADAHDGVAPTGPQPTPRRRGRHLLLGVRPRRAGGRATRRVPGLP